MNYYFLQIKEGPHGGPFYDCVDKWLSKYYAVVFINKSIQNFYKIDSKLDGVSEDVVSFINTFKTDDEDDSIIISIGEKKEKNTGNERDYLYFYRKNGKLKEINDKDIEIDKKKHYSGKDIDKAIGFNVKLLKEIPVVNCPLVLAMIKSNQQLARGTFKPIKDYNSYIGNRKAIDYILDEKKVKVGSFEEYLECLAPVEFETLIAKMMEEQGYFVPAYKGGMLKDYDLICKKNTEQVNIQVKLNLSKSTYNAYKKKDLVIYCITSEINNPEIKINDCSKIEKELKKLKKTKYWLKKSLYWVDFDF